VLDTPAPSTKGKKLRFLEILYSLALTLGGLLAVFLAFAERLAGGFLVVLLILLTVSALLWHNSGLYPERPMEGWLKRINWISRLIAAFSMAGLVWFSGLFGVAAALASINPVSPALSGAALKAWNLEEEGTAVAIFVAVLIVVVALVNLVISVEYPRRETSV